MKAVDHETDSRGNGHEAKGTTMKRIWIVMLAVAMAAVIAMPAGAKKPDKPGKPNTGFKPMACQVDVAFLSADVRTNGVLAKGVDADDDGEFTLEAEGFNVTRYVVEPVSLLDPDDVLCVKVRLDVDEDGTLSGTLSDLRVRWLDCQDLRWLDCQDNGLFLATGKNLRNFNNGDVFSAGVSVADWIDSGGVKTVAVMPNTKSDTATMKVTIGIDQPDQP